MNNNNKLNITVEYCINMKEKYGMETIINDGIVRGFTTKSVSDNEIDNMKKSFSQTTKRCFSL